MGRDFQKRFNVRTGSIPARQNVPLDKFDECAKTSSKDFVAAAKSGACCRRWRTGMALSTVKQAAIRKLASAFWNNDQISLADAIKRLQGL